MHGSLALATAFPLIGACVVACSSADPAPPPWQLTWSDEFNGTALDTTKWSYDTGNMFGTQQLDVDTMDPSNVSVGGGQLSITARYDGQTYTSGRLETQGHFSQKYGRFEARIQIPQGAGMWPAFWLLGTNYASVGWPQCGEIDVMENHGSDPTTVVGSFHGPAPGGADYLKTAGYKLPGGSFSAGFHTFAVEWEPGVVRWYADDALYETQSSDLLPRTDTWVFDQPFFVIVNLAVGGKFGPPDATTVFPQTMLVDYVRVYARAGESS